MSPRSPRPAPTSPGIPERQSSSRSRSNERERERREQYFLGRYRVVSELGRGGMASVHLGRLDGPGGFQKWVAVKRIHAHLVENDQFVDMFLDEARMAAGISHNNVAHVFDLGKDDDTYWLVMEYLHGEPLREIMRRHEDRRSPMPTAIAARICADAADGLHAAHELRGKGGELLGLVHRDINPHNLFVTYDGCTKLVDFGIAKATGRLATTDAGQLKGKIAYMAPEQVQNQELNRTTDIYALGIVLWELTTNQRLFRGDSDLDTLVKVQAGEIARPSSVVHGYSKDLERIVLRALASRKEDRFQTARELGRALRAFYSKDGALVDQEDVAAYLRDAFGERIARRDAHLTWASEVTSFIDVAPQGAELPGRRSSAPPGRPASGGSSPPRPGPPRGEGSHLRSPMPPRPQAAPPPHEEQGPISEPDDDATLVAMRPRDPDRAQPTSNDENTVIYPLGPEEPPRRSSERLSRASGAGTDSSPAGRADPRLQSSGHGLRPPSGHEQRPPSGHEQRPPSGHEQRPPSGHEQLQPSGYEGISARQNDVGQVRHRSFVVEGPPSSAQLGLIPSTQARTDAQRRALVAVVVLAAIGLLGVLALFAALLPRLEMF